MGYIRQHGYSGVIIIDDYDYLPKWSKDGQLMIWQQGHRVIDAHGNKGRGLDRKVSEHKVHQRAVLVIKDGPICVTQKYPEELTNVIKSGLFAALAGLIYGGLPAARHARERYIQASQAEMYSSRVDAVRSAHNAAIRGFVRYGWRWSWRVAVFVTLFNSVSTGISVYRDKYTISHYAAAGAVTGGLFRLNLGLGGLVAGTIIGAVLGIPTGALIIGMQSLTGEAARNRRRRERRELYDLKMGEWTARMQLTDELIRDLNTRSTEDTKDDMQRIQELLGLPKNEDVTNDSSK